MNSKPCCASRRGPLTGNHARTLASKTTRLLLAATLAIFAVAREAQAFAPQGLTVYTTANAATAGTKPSGVLVNPWDTLDAGDSLTIAPGATVWFGFLNTESSHKRKYFRFELHAPAGGANGLTFPDAGGFTTGDDSQRAGSKLTFFYSDTNLRVREYRFTPQPEWERIACTNPTGAAIDVQIAAHSVCADSRPDTVGSTFTLSAASIGSATPGAMVGSPHFGAIWVFPVANPVNPMGAHSFVAPLATGTWQRSLVTATPFGEPRPLGGIRWSTLGQGLAPDEDFGLVLSMVNAPADLEYEVFLTTAGGQQSMRLHMDWTNLEPISYCAGKSNSLGCTSAIGSQGMPSATAQGGFLVTCSQMRNNKPGLLLYSFAGRGALPFQGGTLCLLAPIRRTPGFGSGGSPAPANDCTGAFAIDMNAFGRGLLGGTPAPEFSQPGRIYDCQWWARDPQDQFGSSLSDGLECVIGN